MTDARNERLSQPKQGLCMIKLIITSDSSPPETRRFNQSSIIIGGEHAPHADIKLAGLSLQDRHIQLIKHQENNEIKYFVTNIANDPFVTLNNLPFGKQPIYGNDVIQVGGLSLHFESETESLAEDPSPAPAPIVKLNTQQASQGTKLSLKDYYLSEYDDDEESSVSPFDKNNNGFNSQEFAKRWRYSLSIFGGMLGAIALIAAIFYLWASDQTEEEEIKAAKSVADIAMSLTYAQLKHIHPQNQNWSDPEFIKNNLTPILAPNYLSFADVDSHGQFANSPYILRIYTSSDLTQFLVIAQPSPSLLQWLIPKASIIVDSSVMEIRKLKDLKALNRLIVNSSNLETANANEISNLVKQGELIPLSHLISKAENQGLAPPKALGLIHPGAENFVYNAPRYYLLGENVLKRSLDLTDKAEMINELDILQQELNSLLAFRNFVLYSSNGIRHALKAQKALAIVTSKDKFLIAYLQLNNHGKITNTHLLIDDAQSDLAAGEKTDLPRRHEMAFQEYQTLNLETAIQDRRMMQDIELESLRQMADMEKIDVGTPLFHQQITMADARQSVLKPLAEQMISLLEQQTSQPQPEFAARFSELLREYFEADNGEKKNK